MIKQTSNRTGAIAPRSFLDDNKEFERWLRSECKVVARDLEEKHKRMKDDPFVFLRATFFRWARRIEAICPELKDAPRVPSIGDTHIENFGTWRDVEGRLVWGVNDFDEAAIMAYPFDLVRLATSARLAPKAKKRKARAMTHVGNGGAAKAILDGYKKGLTRPRPSLLDEQASWMRAYVACTDDERQEFWDEVGKYPRAKPRPPVAAALRSKLPPDASFGRFARRVAGAGSLGRPRFVAIAEWRGGQVVREAKALVPSAWDWAHDKHGKLRFLDLATGPYRAPDPHLTLERQSGFVIRRLAPDSRKINLGDHANMEVELDLLNVMGFDIGAIHAAGGAPERIAADLRKRDDNWLHAAAKAAAAFVEGDFREWRRHG
ncbi:MULTISPECIES: DUF2252 domain-containing protein [unclassified Bradyrhizobium]|uniref:DUF2252 domain-containing protein n=1 Tax=unclassified Bradyrhizobium TaxID=2631580 RepID=UPI00211DED01|nr:MULTISPECIES: DUF2252 domain-containing protein [unclassified Bradyrhizobium]MDD1537198.1 hypothetical protein [Bradyrhizobium sp. WBOS8]MDD1586734.1 hypothetical protein [Bradyrhizobium sp. WBOS4]UUO46669.1 hypothetical protein DCM78_06840 [Bradyrhizobium sp. WBOS04]UUO59526.1 hypothetical protein DCM80_10300 [Bradyrhizobium sp. WBOS08]